MVKLVVIFHETFNRTHFEKRINVEEFDIFEIMKLKHKYQRLHGIIFDSTKKEESIE